MNYRKIIGNEDINEFIITGKHAMELHFRGAIFKYFFMLIFEVFLVELKNSSFRMKISVSKWLNTFISLPYLKKANCIRAHIASIKISDSGESRKY